MELRIEEIQEFFFKGMLNGYAAGIKGIALPGMPGYKRTEFREGDFYLLDRWVVTPLSDKSVGDTIIWHRDVPVWAMYYGGRFDKNTIAFLKRMLFKAYEARVFIGGRGLPDVESIKESLRYINVPRGNDFSRFSGREEVFNTKMTKILGWHEYWGMSLL